MHISTSNYGKSYWLYSIALFSFWFGEQIIYAFQTVILSDYFSNFQIGTLLSIGPFATIATASLIGNFCDKFSMENVLCVLLFGSILIGTTFYSEHSYPFFVGVFILAYIFKNPFDGLFNGFVSIRHQEGPGTILFWGPVAKIFSPFVVGMLALKVGISIHIVAFAVAILFIILIKRDNEQAKEAGEFIDRKTRRVTFAETVKLIKIKPFFVFLFSIFILVLGLKNYYTFASLAMLETGMTNAQIGTAWSIAGVSGCIAFFGGGVLAKKAGIFKLHAVAILSALIFFIMVGFFPCYWTWLVGMFIGSFCAPLFELTTVLYIRKYIPEELIGSANSLFITFAWGFGSGFGGLIGSTLSVSSAVIPFKLAVTFAVISLIVFLPVSKLTKKYCQENGIKE